MSKVKVNKRLLALILAGTMTAGVTAFVLSALSNKKVEKEENRIGYTDINPFFNFNVDEEDFVILDIGDHDTVRTHFEDRKMKYCNENDISLGIIVSPDSETESDIYDDVEYAKGIVKEYGIDFPVYLDIDRIITNDNLNNEMKTKLIKDFVEKCSANNIYVGLYGTDTNLCRVKQYCGITEYDAFVVMDKEVIEYDGSYNVYQDLEGNIESYTDVSTIIQTKALNQSNQFTNDGSYTVSTTDDLVDIALRYGMSVNELLEFNEISKGDVVEGTVLRIPSIIDKSVPENLEVTYEELQTPIRGCDISYAQGEDIEWDKMSENFEFIILRCCQGTSPDSCFETNAKNANINNIPIGAYCYNNFNLNNSESKEDFIKKQEAQADYALSLLKNKKIDYPVYLDIEAPNGCSLSDELDEEAVQNMIKIWCEKMSSSGYIPGLYCNQSGFDFLQSCVDEDLTEVLEVWIAGGEQYTGGTQSIPFEEITASDSVKENIPGAATVQSTDSAVGAGAGNDEGHLDINFSYKDYTDKNVIGTTTETFAIKEFDRVDGEMIGIAAGGVILVGGSATGIALAMRKKNKSKVKTRRK